MSANSQAVERCDTPGTVFPHNANPEGVALSYPQAIRFGRKHLGIRKGISQNASMNKPEQLNAFPLVPVFKQSAPNEKIELGTTVISISGDTQEPPINAEAQIVFTTEDRLEIRVPNTSGKPSLRRFFESPNDGTKLTFLDSGDVVDTSLNGMDKRVDVYHPMRSPVKASSKNVPLKRTVFHLINWPQFSGADDFMLVTGIAPYSGIRMCGRLSMKVEGWLIRIVEVDKLRQLLTELKEKGGYAITHVGVIEKEYDATYSEDEAEELLAMLNCFFSFVLARWAGPQLYVGYDESENTSFEKWGFGPLANGAWKGHISWFDERHAEIIPLVLHGFLNLWKQSIWKEALHEVIYWYVAASRVGSGVNVDSALLFTQSALERLACTYCVLDRRMVSKEAFRQRGLRAADKLRMLISNLDLPLEIPQETKSLLSKTKKGKTWIDSMDALTDLRNGLVHPDKDDEPPEDAYYDAWRLSLWYIDLILLRLCGHEGKYANRLSSRFVGQVELVPWAKNTGHAEITWPRPNDYY